MADPIERYEQASLLVGTPIELLHTAFASILTLFLTLVGFSYQGSATTLFKEHSLVISLFMVDIFVYIIAFLNVAIRSTNSSSTIPEYSNTELTFKYIFLISGAIGCELLLFILVTLLRWFVINMFVLLFFEVLRRWHRQISELLATITSSVLVPANNYLIHNLFQRLYRNGILLLARLCLLGQEVFAVYPLFTHRTRAQQDDQDVTVLGNDILLCNNVFHSAFYGEDSWFLRIYNRGFFFPSVGRSVEHEAGDDVQMIHMV